MEEEPKGEQFVIIGQMQKSHVGKVFEIAQKNKLSYWSPEDYKAEIIRNDSCCLVAENQTGEIAGFLVARLIMQEGCAELNNIAVLDSYKRKKIGEALLCYLTKKCFINHLDQINLEVRESNQNAIQFYLKHNFQKAGVRKNFYTQPTENAITMIKFLNK